VEKVVLKREGKRCTDRLSRKKGRKKRKRYDPWGGRGNTDYDFDKEGKAPVSEEPGEDHAGGCQSGLAEGMAWETWRQRGWGKKGKKRS